MKEDYIQKNDYRSIFFTDKAEECESELKSLFLNHLEYSLIKDITTVKPWDIYYALALSLRDLLIERWLRTQYEYRKQDVKKVYYLSLEFLLGRMLTNSLINLDVYNEVYDMLKEMGISLEDIIELEPDMGLGNGGLGRLAACFMDSLATQAYPAYGYGIRYDYGIFKQQIVQGYQVEEPDNWRKNGCPWEINRPELTYRVRFGGKVISETLPDGRIEHHWIDTEDVLAVAWDIPVPGYQVDNVNNLRLWQATSTAEFDLEYFNNGDYVKAVEKKTISENISKVLYPNDNVHLGRMLRLQQEYFFVSATLQDIFAHWKRYHNSFNNFADKIAIQLNDTHPALAIPEMLRILIDEERMSFENAWEITKRCFSYTNHTILPEALEKWGIALFEELLPRHLMLIYQINNVVMEEVVRLYPGDLAKMRNLSIIEETNGKAIRMAQLAIHSSHTVNGVAKLHTKILCERIFPDLAELYPGKFQNKTNGITPRLWLHTCNPQLASLISEFIGSGWITNLEEIRGIEKYINDSDFRTSFAEVKDINKSHLSRYIYRETGIRVQVNSLFDAQIKRLHEYKRQLLNVMGTIARYFRIKDNPNGNFVPRTVIFAGKAAPGYFLAKRLIKLINNIGEVVNKDPDIKDRLKVVFLPNYCVSLAERIIPAADLSIQISTAGYEASGTGNMKFALNGALTLGTLDGANIEMAEEIGAENMFIFGLTAEEVKELNQSGYNPRSYYESDPELKRVVDSLIDGTFEEGEKDLFLPIWKALMEDGDSYLNMADFRAFVETSNKVDEFYLNREEWITKAILNVARVGKFSSDRAIKEYADDIWGIKPLPLELNNGNNS
ncbi:MAG TPA: glycogen/starch/alpha-glucan phosphorylase [Candidatus Cloacimonas acidaminovorans]|nr:glycogen/starch/alpha-glucan phosphorylase [Candidatus Cloacimonas acidaminovorans]HOT39187.1 glycogen/starch/alpha-glucan phosphorylase [Candidatus Cloacimonas acidaminovorans]HPL52344.1 glycogen/starch/alpha-glucan phosphorylase [Candidatus Cloacimonas acidaminovorans]HQF35668.1 glycogen/starch/alpha-glucan phosphorylase [Candidatus Cloacimonas acidaminovorans]HQI53313.1 glycogen/starch/alpha-glucan phosphorylase [Candidatus Cloacimonas acidaminovorans]